MPAPDLAHAFVELDHLPQHAVEFAVTIWAQVCHEALDPEVVQLASNRVATGAATLPYLLTAAPGDLDLVMVLGSPLAQHAQLPFEGSELSFEGQPLAVQCQAHGVALAIPDKHLTNI